MMKNWKGTVIHHLGIWTGALLFALSYSWFLVPYKIAPGGVGGLSQIMYHIFNIPVGLSMVLFNVPLFVLSLFLLGKRFGTRSIYGMIATAILTDVVSFPTLVKLGFIKDITKYTWMDGGEQVLALLGPGDIYLSAIAGSVLLGLGLGIIFRFGGSTGGTDIPVAFIKQKTGMSIGTGYWVVESFIILTVGIVFHDVKLVIWGYLNLFMTSKITDLASEGMPYVKGVYVISSETDAIKEQIYNKINRGVTFFKAEGGYTGKEMNVLFCAINRRQVSLMRTLIKEIDPKAFVLLTDVHDVMGYGFRSRNLDLSDGS